MMNADADPQKMNDLDQNCESLKIEKSIYLRILARAIEQTAQDIHNLETALSAGDFETVQAVSHRLKGDYDNLRITHMSAIARQMNENVKTQPDKEKLMELLNAFKADFEKLQKDVQDAG